MKRKILLMATVILTLALTICALTITVSAEEAAPEVIIEKFNLAFENNVYLKYAVRFTGVDDTEITSGKIGMLYFLDSDSGFAPGSEDYSSETTGYTEIDGVKYYVFEYTQLAAKQLTDYVYSVAYLEHDGEIYYSEPVKYSALEYAYNRLGKTDAGTDKEELKQLLRDMLAYGASAQKYFDYKADRLATDDFYQLTVVGGTLDDGFTKGLYHNGETATLIAPETNGELVFAGWENSDGVIVSSDNPAAIDEFSKNDTLTAIYQEEIKYSKGLKYTSNGNGTCYVSGIGTCTDTDIIIPEKSPIGDVVTGIGESAFNCCFNIKSVIVSSNVTSIGGGAFFGCGSLKSISLPDSLISIESTAFYDCDITEITIPENVTRICGSSFWGCDKLLSITIDENNTAYKVIDGNIYTYDEKTLVYYLSSKTESTFILPKGTTSIGSTAFYYNNFSAVVIPKSLTTVNANAFSNSYNLTSVYYTRTEDEWNNINVEDGNSDFTDATRYYYSETEPTTEGNFWHYVDDIPTIWPEYVAPSYSEGLEYQLRGYGNNQYYAVIGLGTCSDKNIVIPLEYNSKPVKEIDSMAFSNDDLQIKQTTFIMDPCFENIYGYIESITIFGNITTINTNAFNLHLTLKNINVIDSEHFYSEDGVLYSADRKNLLYYPSGRVEDTVIIPDGVTSINYAFSYCHSIKSVVIPKNVTSIGDFNYCLSLRDVYYTGTEKEWNAITINNAYLNSATIHFNYIPEE